MPVQNHAGCNEVPMLVLGANTLVGCGHNATIDEVATLVTVVVATSVPEAYPGSDRALLKWGVQTITS